MTYSNYWCFYKILLCNNILITAFHCKLVWKAFIPQGQVVEPEWYTFKNKVIAVCHDLCTPEHNNIWKFSLVFFSLYLRILKGKGCWKRPNYTWQRCLSDLVPFSKSNCCCHRETLGCVYITRDCVLILFFTMFHVSIIDVLALCTACMYLSLC